MIGHLDLPAGISGDMFLGMVVDAGASLEAMEAAVKAVGGERLGLRSREVQRAGLRGIKVDVILDGHVLHESGGPPDGNGHSHDHGAQSHHHHDAHHHTAYAGIVSRIESADLDPEVRAGSLEAFRLLGEAESAIHGVALPDVHFHEVGSLDAVADIVGSVAGFHSLGIRTLFHGPVCVGGGRVDASHGTLPVPAPATLALLKGRPCVLEPEAGELVTPTGAALLVALARPAPGSLTLVPDRVGYGAGSRDPGHRPNLARLVLGSDPGDAPGRRQVAVIEAALDDATPEDGGHLLQTLMESGALDVSLSPLIMKKGRPGFLVRVIAPADQGAVFAERVVRLSSSLGARWRIEDRLELDRRIDQVTLPDGEVRVKVATLPDGSERIHPEHDDVAAVARRRGKALSSVRDEVETVWNATRS